MSLENTATAPGLVTLFSQVTDDGSIALSSIRERANLELSSFAELASQQLQQLDISMPPAISLISTPACQLDLENNHPHAEEIRTWLQGNDNITRKFKEVEVLYEIVRAAESIGETFPESSTFHIGLTSAGPIAYFEDSHRP
ncbi:MULTISPECIES: hypothetical protein [Chromobacterium]|uniref:Fumarate lyase N-terminal domain-containing protein n=2 Tax=Chromobacterium TaxID=535 RepID=A0ABS3GRD2_9NEIS|nr:MULTISPECIES: hypothetical protein [Chromobacterium]AXT47900.1 hypothetical protein D1345_17745 [Chromobacterium rhizoryzae]MBK0416436.1 hypothetical protein [Chromobacterium haemolyticum]MBO0417610.1 hypothetical protein [Chromobacterium haemolyticum]MBO0500802.1 hypothetical protein [Chromobacterium haemolyticum]OQS39725.1 hypothetical protein B0T40_03030 [Chromobacterium haemolyticum]